jgi:hypothetical protein
MTLPIPIAINDQVELRKLLAALRRKLFLADDASADLPVLASPA